MDSLIDEFCSIFEADGFHIKKLNHKIFICGGEISERSTKRHPSIRDFFYKEIQKILPDIYERLVLAEDINQWFGDNYYDDLLAMETDLAELVTGIPIFVESAGSLAELGAFSVIEPIRKKLLVFVSKEHYETRSFISLGPLKLINDKQIRPYNFNKGNKKTYSAKDFIMSKDLVCEDIEKYFAINDCNYDFVANKVAHLIFLICDLVFMTGSVKRKEIDYMLEKILGKKIESEVLSKCLWVAGRMGMLNKITVGEKYYCVPNDFDGEYVSFSYKEKVSEDKKDKGRWRAIFLDEIKKDKRRFQALKEVGESNA